MRVFILTWQYSDKSAYDIYKVFTTLQHAEEEKMHLEKVTVDREWVIHQVQVTGTSGQS